MSFTKSPTDWRRNVAVVAGGRALSLLGDEVAVVALVLRASDAPNAALMVTLLLVAAMLPALVLAPVAGLLVDRLPTRALVAVTSLLQAGLCGVLILVDQAAAVLVLVAALNAAQTVVGPAWQALLPSLVPEDRLGPALSSVQAAGAVAGMLGPALGGLLVGVAGVPAALAVDAVSFLALTGAAVLVRGDRRPSSVPEPESTLRQSVAGFRHVRRDSLLATLVGMIVCFVVVLGAVNVAEVFLVTDVLGGSPTAYGLMGTLFAVGSLAGAVLAAKLDPPRGATGDQRLVSGLLGGCLTMSAGLGLLAASPTLVVAAAASLVIGVGNACLNVWAQQLVIRRTPDSILGRVFAALQAVVNAAMMVALAIGGAAVAAAGPRELIAVAAGGTAAVILVGSPILLRRRADSSEVADVPEAAVPDCGHGSA